MDELTTHQVPVTPSSAPIEGFANSDGFVQLRQHLADLAAANETAKAATPNTPTTTETAGPSKAARLATWTKRLIGLGEDNPNDPMRLFAAIGVATVTGVISYTTLADLGSGMGFGNIGSQLFPIGIDAAVFLFTRTWMNRRLSPETRKFAKTAALFFMVMSVLGNAIEHGKRTYDTWNAHRAADALLHQQWQPSRMDIVWLAVTLVFSALMPLALGLSLHVISRVSDDVRSKQDAQVGGEEKPAVKPPIKTRKRPQVDKKSPKRAAKPEPEQTPQSPETSAESDQTADVIDFKLVQEFGEKRGRALAEWLNRLDENNGRGPSLAEVDKALFGSVTKTTAQAVKAYVEKHGDPRKAAVNR